MVKVPSAAMVTTVLVRVEVPPLTQGTVWPSALVISVTPTLWLWPAMTISMPVVFSTRWRTWFSGEKPVSPVSMAAPSPAPTRPLSSPEWQETMTKSQPSSSRRVSCQ